MSDTARHNVVVAGIGSVYSGDAEIIASEMFDKYVELSRSGCPGVGNARVTWFTGDEIVVEYEPVNCVTMCWVLVEQPGTVMHDREKLGSE